MKKLLILFVLLSTQLFSQGVADKTFYLVDSLNLSSISPEDKSTLDEYLSKYHKSETDTQKFTILEEIITEIQHESWMAYQEFQYEALLASVKSAKNPDTKKRLEELLLTAQLNMSTINVNSGHYEKALDQAKQASIIAIERNDSSTQAYILKQIGVIYNYMNKIPETLKYYKKSYELSLKTNDIYMATECLNWIGSVYRNQGKFQLALNCYHKAITLSEEINDTNSIARTQWTLGVLYHVQKDMKSGLEYYKKSLHNYQQLGNLEGQGRLHDCIATTYLKQKEYEKALVHSDTAIKIFRSINNMNGITEALGTFGVLMMEMGKYNEAEMAFKEELENCLLLGYSPDISTSYVRLGQVNRKLNKLSKAKAYGEKSLAEANKLGFLEKKQQAAELLYQVHSDLNNHKEALGMYKLYIEMRDSISNEENQKAMIRQQTQYEFEKEQIRKENAAKEKARIAAKVTERRNNLQYSLIFLGILVLFGIVLSLGFIKVSPNLAEGIIFFAFLILFEFLLVFTEPYLESYTNGEPMYNLLANSALALVIFPVHAILEKLLKKRIVKS